MFKFIFLTLIIVVSAVDKNNNGTRVVDKINNGTRVVDKINNGTMLCYSEFVSETGWVSISAEGNRNFILNFYENGKHIESVPSDHDSFIGERYFGNNTCKICIFSKHNNQIDVSIFQKRIEIKHEDDRVTVFFLLVILLAVAIHIR